jgi:hypothetical protein
MKIIIQETVNNTVVEVVYQTTKISIKDNVSFLDLTDVMDNSYVGKNGFVPTVNETTGKMELKEPSGGGGGDAVSSVFNRTGNVTAQNGDYNADQITETASKVFVSPSEKTAIGHANRSVLDAITESFTTALKNSYDSVVTGYNALVSTGQRLITSSEITKLSNTIGTNTGDETTISIQTKRPIKTVNDNSLEGSGNISIPTGISDAPNDLNAYVRSGLSWVVGYTKSAIDSIISGIQTALDLKANKANVEEIIRSKANGTFGSHTGNTLETVLLAIDIDANEFVAGDRLIYKIFTDKSAAVGNVQFRVRVGTTGTTSDSLIATSVNFTGNNARYMLFDRERNLFLEGNSFRCPSASVASATDINAMNGATTLVSLNPSNAWKFVITAQLSAGSETTNLVAYTISKIKSL